MPLLVPEPVTVGRGAWPPKGTGGTLLLDGNVPSPGNTKPTFYRAPAVGAPMPGITAARAIRANAPVDINDYAVWSAVKAIQKRCGLPTQDGIFGNATKAAVISFQQRAKLTADGIVGPSTARRMWEYVLQTQTHSTSTVIWAAAGHIGYESGWDSGAVGVTTPVDLGLAQINGPSHPTLTIDQRFDPWVSLSWVAGFVANNLTAMAPSVDDGLAAYNLGIAGAKSWRAAGRPQWWGTTDVWKYITRIKQFAGPKPA